MYSVDHVMAEMDDAMLMLRKALRGIPARREGFLKDHESLAKKVAHLHTELRYARVRSSAAR
jgi:hypothetical protein